MSLSKADREILGKQLLDARRAAVSDPLAPKCLLLEVAAVTACRAVEMALALDVPVGNVIDKAIEGYFKARSGQ
jgi:hypothetical protein